MTNTPDVLTDEVADLTIGLLLATVRRIPAAERHLREGKWPSGAFPLTSSLRDRKIGILGLGRIGKAIAKRLEAFGLPISYYGRHKQDGVEYAYVADPVELARQVDVLISVIPGGKATEKTIGAAVFEALGPDGIFLNVGRGTVVDEAALIDALKSNKIQAAGLDVYADEPNVPAELMALENTVLLPHVASGTVHTRNAMGQLRGGQSGFLVRRARRRDPRGGDGGGGARQGRQGVARAGVSRWPAAWAHGGRTRRRSRKAWRSG